MIIGEWHFEVIQVRCRRVTKYGDPYTAITNITITDGEPHVEGALSSIKAKRKDKIALTNYIKHLGYDSYTSSYFQNGKRVITTKKL
tara:strand:+ start:360 stop:620 length:261 start_codon:yes stop_codon:yes gene_type:complete